MSTPQSLTSAPFGFLALATRAMADAMELQTKATIEALERVSEACDAEINWLPTGLPVIDPASLMDEEGTREAFHRLSDVNLRGWEYAAETLKLMPSWTTWPSKVPGTVLTDAFDKIRRNGMKYMPANDRWASAAEAFSPSQFWTTRQTAAGPALLDAPDGDADDLTAIKGIGKKLSAMLSDLGVFHFAQIAEWTDADGEWIDDQLAFKGRVAREDWIAQAKALVEQSAAA